MQHRQTSFRRDGRRAHEWRRWVAANRTLIDEVALPADVVATRQDFDYLLQHGYNRAGWWNEQPWFEVDKAPDRRDGRFWNLLESYVSAFHPVADRPRQLEVLARSFRPTDGVDAERGPIAALIDTHDGAP